MKSKYKIILATVIVIVAGIAAIYWFGFAKNSGNKIIDPKKIEALAKCLTQKGVAMYGAYWCPHCQRQKKLFGDSFKYVSYVECTKDIKKCQEKKIEGYPTWIFKNGERIKGEATFEELAKKTACKAP
jgi:glutaredoxin